MEGQKERLLQQYNKIENELIELRGLIEEISIASDGATNDGASHIENQSSSKKKAGGENDTAREAIIHKWKFDKKKQQVNNAGFVFGDRVEIIRDTASKWRRRTLIFYQSDLVGKGGVVIGTTPCFAYILIDGGTQYYRKGNETIVKRHRS